jgi:PAS domain S-box-containing protein
VTAFSFRARVGLFLTASFAIGGLAITLGARHLEALHAQRAVVGDREFDQAIWWTLACAVAAANLAGAAVVALTTRGLASRIAQVRDAVLTLAAPDTPVGPVADGTADDEFAPLQSAVLTARASLQASLTRVRMESDRNRAIVDTVLASAFAIDGGGRILSANPAAAQMFSRPLQSLVGTVLSDLVATESLRLTVDDLGTVTFAGSEHDRRFATQVRLHGRRTFPAEVAIAPLRLDGQHAWAVFVHDLTAQQQAESELGDARQALDDANTAKAAFLGRMSQELRSPLSSMIGFTRIVVRSKSSELSERDRHYLDRVQASSEHLLGFVDDIFDLARIESGRVTMVIAPVDVVPMIRDIIAQFESKVADRPVVLQADIPESAAIASVDAVRLRQVITSLVDNAVKFTARGRITVSVTRHHSTDMASAILVSDTGIGIPLERQGRIFDSFEQGGDDTSHRYGGSGLGLALSWRIAKQMGCMLSVESTAGAGSTFTLAFDRGPAPIAPMLAGAEGTV